MYVCVLLAYRSIDRSIDVHTQTHTERTLWLGIRVVVMVLRTNKTWIWFVDAGTKGKGTKQNKTKQNKTGSTNQQNTTDRGSKSVLVATAHDVT